MVQNHQIDNERIKKWKSKAGKMNVISNLRWRIRDEESQEEEETEKVEQKRKKRRKTYLHDTSSTSHSGNETSNKVSKERVWAKRQNIVIPIFGSGRFQICVNRDCIN